MDIFRFALKDPGSVAPDPLISRVFSWKKHVLPHDDSFGKHAFETKHTGIKYDDSEIFHARNCGIGFCWTLLTGGVVEKFRDCPVVALDDIWPEVNDFFPGLIDVDEDKGFIHITDKPMRNEKNVLRKYLEQGFSVGVLDTVVEMPPTPKFHQRQFSESGITMPAQAQLKPSDSNVLGSRYPINLDAGGPSTMRRVNQGVVRPPESINVGKPSQRASAFELSNRTKGELELLSRVEGVQFQARMLQESIEKIQKTIELHNQTVVLNQVQNQVNELQVTMTKISKKKNFTPILIFLNGLITWMLFGFLFYIIFFGVKRTEGLSLGSQKRNNPETLADNPTQIINFGPIPDFSNWQKDQALENKLAAWYYFTANDGYPAFYNAGECVACTSFDTDYTQTNPPMKVLWNGNGGAVWYVKADILNPAGFCSMFAFGSEMMVKGTVDKSKAYGFRPKNGNLQALGIGGDEDLKSRGECFIFTMFGCVFQACQYAKPGLKDLIDQMADTEHWTTLSKNAMNQRLKQGDPYIKSKKFNNKKVVKEKQNKETRDLMKEHNDLSVMRQAFASNQLIHKRDFDSGDNSTDHNALEPIKIELFKNLLTISFYGTGAYKSKVGSQTFNGYSTGLKIDQHELQPGLTDVQIEFLNFLVQKTYYTSKSVSCQGALSWYACVNAALMLPTLIVGLILIFVLLDFSGYMNPIAWCFVICSYPYWYYQSMRGGMTEANKFVKFMSEKNEICIICGNPMTSFKTHVDESHQGGSDSYKAKLRWLIRGGAANCRKLSLILLSLVNIILSIIIIVNFDMVGALNVESLLPLNSTSCNLFEVGASSAITTIVKNNQCSGNSCTGTADLDMLLTLQSGFTISFKLGDTATIDFRVEDALRGYYFKEQYVTGPLTSFTESHFTCNDNCDSCLNMIKMPSLVHREFSKASTWNCNPPNCWSIDKGCLCGSCNVKFSSDPLQVSELQKAYTTFNLKIQSGAVCRQFPVQMETLSNFVRMAIISDEADLTKTMVVVENGQVFQGSINRIGEFGKFGDFKLMGTSYECNPDTELVRTCDFAEIQTMTFVHCCKDTYELKNTLSVLGQVKNSGIEIADPNSKIRFILTVPDIALMINPKDVKVQLTFINISGCFSCGLGAQLKFKTSSEGDGWFNILVDKGSSYPASVQVPKGEMDMSVTVFLGSEKGTTVLHLGSNSMEFSFVLEQPPSSSEDLTDATAPTKSSASGCDGLFCSLSFGLTWPSWVSWLVTVILSIIVLIILIKIILYIVKKVHSEIQYSTTSIDEKIKQRHKEQDEALDFSQKEEPSGKTQGKLSKKKNQ